MRCPECDGLGRVLACSGCERRHVCALDPSRQCLDPYHLRCPECDGTGTVDGTAIEALLASATADGDEDTVRVCRLALDGDGRSYRLALEFVQYDAQERAEEAAAAATLRECPACGGLHDRAGVVRCVTGKVVGAFIAACGRKEVA